MKNRFITRIRPLLSLLLPLIALPCVAAGQPARWMASWASAQMPACAANQLPHASFQGATLRQTVHLSLGGSRVRLRLSNVFGAEPLVLRSVKAARAVSGQPGAIDAASSTPVLFDGKDAVTVPAGAELFSDAVALPAEPLGDLAVSMVLESAPACATSHPGAHATAFLAAGAHADDARLNGAESFLHWYFLSAIDVDNPQAQGVVAAFGDSITDGHGATDDKNDRWPDVLATRLVAQGWGVVNLGIGGNCVLKVCLGPSAVSRFDRDVLGISGVRSMILLEGINDIGTLDRLADHPQAEHDQLVASLEDGYRQLASRAHAHGLRVLGATMTPFLGSDYYHPGPLPESDRVRLNQWIRWSGVFDALVEFDALAEDAKAPGHLLPAVDSGDHLHPGPEGYRRMGEAVPLAPFVSQ